MSDNPLADWVRAAETRSPGGDPTPAQTEAAPERVEDPTAGALGQPWPRTPPVSPPPAPWEEPPDTVPDATPRRRLALAGALVWLVVGGLGALVVARGVTWAGSPDPVGSTPDVASEATSSDVAAVPAMAAGAVAATAVRQAVTGMPTPEGDERRYVDLAVPEAVEHHGSVTVVTVRTVVLEGSAGAWHAARSARFAVPVGWADDQPAVLGAPWALPAGPALTETDHRWGEVGGEEDPVRRALEQAGYGDLGGLELTAREDLAGVLRARVEARAPGERQRAQHEVWLHAGPPPEVVGLQPAHAAEQAGKAVHPNGAAP